ncbi:ABC transporter ATP-binding protein [Bacillus sp. FJAT-27986]|uniref:ABC transporter ATP-binding protein n=1 Tax=Bacillus sp. FJAT-27986 TaxID=1743146 RepID=UPI00080AD974|nr:ABC transporter ATP-binding protein [Bacillus sp. FJAT-27986]OCA81897.1 hypothetical protein A8L44_14995 [Bacillus sp. FJAT-27986]
MLTVESLSAGYHKNKQVLQDFSIKVESGEFFALLGPNGSGKTTLIKSILGKMEYKEGTSIINGKRTSSYKTGELAKIAAVLSQEHMVGIDFTVEEIVLLGRYPYQEKGFFNHYRSEDYAIVDECLAQTNMLKFKYTYFSSLSGGEKQRVLLAKALAQQPKLLFLDEPTNHLDVKHTIELLNLLKRLQLQNGLTIVAILHDLNMAALYADRCALLKDGRKVAEGGIDLLYDETLLSSVYEVDLVSRPHPITGTPQIFFTPENFK